MFTNRRYIVFILIFTLALISGAVGSNPSFSFVCWLPFLCFFVAMTSVDAHQYVALQLAKVCLVGTISPFRDRDEQLLWENLIPCRIARLYQLGVIFEFVSFGVLLFLQGWKSVIIAYVIYMILGMFSGLIPFVFKGYYKFELWNITNYVTINPTFFNQRICECSIGVNEVREVLELAGKQKNLNKWFFTKVNPNRDMPKVSAPSR